MRSKRLGDYCQGQLHLDLCRKCEVEESVTLEEGERIFRLASLAQYDTTITPPLIEFLFTRVGNYAIL